MQSNLHMTGFQCLIIKKALNDIPICTKSKGQTSAAKMYRNIP